MALFTVTDYDKMVYEQELKDFLPKKIIDVHTHIWKTEIMGPKELRPGEVKRQVTWPSLVAKDNSVEDLYETYRLMFPDKEVTPLIFGTSDGGVKSIDACDRYVMESAKKTGAPALCYSLPTYSAEELERRVIEGGFLGIKSYLTLAPVYLPEAEIRIFDFFPPHQLEVMNKLGGIVMLHIPRNGRLKDPVNLAQILEIKQKWPKVRLIIAHIGRAYTENDVGDAFKILAPAADLMFDFTANTCAYAMEKLLESFGPDHTMFGSDLPILRMRMKRIEENNTYINLIPPGMYGDPKQDSHLREVSAAEGEKLTFFMYEEIRSFKIAAKNVGLSAADVEKCFYTTAKTLIDGAKADIYGK
ncbi:MAG: amidohydrolase [Clostridia bacterium]|nr:amidohydrolase [Clostridia bacterium]